MPDKTKPPSQRSFAIIEGGDKRPEIKVTKELLDITYAASDALATDPKIYKRAGALVHTVSQEPNIPGGRRTLMIRELPHALLGVHLAQIARWIKFDLQSQTFKRVAVPGSIVSAVYSLGEWEKIRPLLAVVNAPTMRHDGTIIQAKGYDEASGILYKPSREFPQIPEEPTLEDAKYAADHIVEYACDFPFKDDSDRSAWLSAVLTLVARNAIRGVCPLFAIHGNTPGVGKSRLVDLAHVIAYGNKTPRSSISPVQEELRKQITSLLLEGVGAALFDNVDAATKFGGPAFDALLTSDVWRDRELGKIAIKTLPARTVWFVTGNNITLAGDLARRTLRINLESSLADPENRNTFRWGEGEELFRNADRARTLLVTHALTILRAYVVAGRPLRGSKNGWGSYESWVRTIVDPIRWLGWADPLDSRAPSGANGGDDGGDEYVMHAEAIAIAMRAIARPVSARELIDTLYPPNRMHGDGNDAHECYAVAREVLEQATRARGVPELVRVGHFLKRMKNRMLPSGATIIGEMDQHAKIMRWTIKEPTKTEPARDA